MTRVEELLEEKAEGEEKAAEEKKLKGVRVQMAVDIDPAARAGNHWLRLASPTRLIFV